MLVELLNILGVLNYNFLVIVFMFTMFGFYLNSFDSVIIDEEGRFISIPVVILSLIILLGIINYLVGGLFLLAVTIVGALL